MPDPDDVFAQPAGPSQGTDSSSAVVPAWLIGSAFVVGTSWLGVRDAWFTAATVVLVALTLRLLRMGPRASAQSRGLPGHDGPRHDLPSLRGAGRRIVALAWALVAVSSLAGRVDLATVGLVVAAAASGAESLAWLHDGLRLRRAIRAYGATTALAYAGRSGGPWQLSMWEPYILASGERCIVINRHQEYGDMIWEGAELSSPFIELGATGFANLRFVVVDPLRVMFYVQNAQSNAHFLKRRDVRHVWLTHGESDKPASYNERHAHYDLLLVAGQAAVDRYAQNGVKIPAHKFMLVGRPQVQGIEPPRSGPLDDPRVLYAPTWAGLEPSVNFSSLRVGPQIVRTMLDAGLTVVFRPHPLSERSKRHRLLIRNIHEMLEHDRAVTGRDHRWGSQATQEWSLVECANHVDMLVSDVSSVVTDFLPSEKPYALTMMRGDDADLFRIQHSAARGAYLVRSNLEDLQDVLEEMCGADPMAQQRRAVRRYVLTERTGEQAAEDFARVVRSLVRHDSSCLRE